MLLLLGRAYLYLSLVLICRRQLPQPYWSVPGTYNPGASISLIGLMKRRSYTLSYF